VGYSLHSQKVGAAMKKLRKACALDCKCSKRSYVPTGISTRAPNQNLIKNKRTWAISISPLLLTSLHNQTLPHKDKTYV